MYIELVELMGKIESKDINLGNAILFNVIDNEYSFNCILYTNNDINEPFVVLHDIDEKYNSKTMLDIILNKYNLKELKEL